MHCNSVDSSHSSIPYFRHVEGAPIPLRVVEDVPAHWESEVEAELQKQFDPEQAPLMRAVLFHHKSKAIFILVAHHSIADGFSSAFAIRDVLRAISGEPLDPLSLMPSRMPSREVSSVCRRGHPQKAGHAANRMQPERLRLPVTTERIQLHISSGSV
jgi:hypothetical protein